MSSLKYKNKGSKMYNNIYNKDEMMTTKCLANQALFIKKNKTERNSWIL